MAKRTTPTRAELERRITDTESQLIHRLADAADALDGAGDRLMASAAVLSITALGGRVIVDPVAISDGLSADTIAAIRADLARTFEKRTARRPKTTSKGSA